MLMRTRQVFPLTEVHHPQARICGDCEVRHSALFGVLDDAALERIHALIGNVAVEPDRSIYARGWRGDAVFTIRAGLVRFERATEAGDRRIVRLAGRGDLIGQEALLMRPYAEEAIACTPVQLCRIPRSLVEGLGASGAPLARELMRRWQSALEEAETWTADLATGAARRRVLKLLAKLDAHADAAGLFWLPRRDVMGAMLDMTVETCSRIVSQLRRDGVLEVQPPYAARLRRQALQSALAAQDAG
jgi:CRP-like cAMP-binding protein